MKVIGVIVILIVAEAMAFRSIVAGDYKKAAFITIVKFMVLFITVPAFARLYLGITMVALIWAILKRAVIIKAKVQRVPRFIDTQSSNIIEQDQQLHPFLS